MKDYKEKTINLIKKTNSSVAPLALHSFESGVERFAKVIAPMCDQSSTHIFQNRLLKDFSDEELNTISKSPEFILAILSMAKQSTIDFIENL